MDYIFQVSSPLIDGNRYCEPSDLLAHCQFIDRHLKVDMDRILADERCLSYRVYDSAGTLAASSREARNQKEQPVLYITKVPRFLFAELVVGAPMIFAGSWDISDCLGDGDKFDRRKFGRREFPCGHRFNPFYVKSYEPGEWSWCWVGDSHREPRSTCLVKCPKCKRPYFFTLNIAQ